ncbi:dehydrase and lipid transport-domain-containing protein [Lactarius indigo]|nr:dehydrase and lipid transport-domain-containing protein [Lactarius indigo]
MLIIHSAALTAARSIWRAPSHHAQRRHLFRLPDLSSFPSPFADSASVKPQTYHEHKVLPYTRRQLYAVVADVSSYASFLPFCTRSRILRPPTPLDHNTSPPNVQSGALQMEAELTVAFLAFTERYTSRVMCVPHESVRAVAVSSTPLFKMLETTWRFQPVASTSQAHTGLDGASSSLPRPASASTNDTGPTLLSLDLAFEFANPLHAAVSSAFFGKVSALMVKAFEERCVKVYGPG